MPIKLTYFNTNGFAEPIRYMLHYGKLEFEDFRLFEWPLRSEAKGDYPFGKLPVYEKDGQILNQSLAIARYIASEVDLLPSDPWEQAKLDASALNVYDFITKITPFFAISDPKKKEEMKKEKDDILEFFLSRFEKELKAGKGYFGGKLSWADFILVATIERVSFYLGETIQKDYPTIVALIAKIHSFSGVKEYVTKRGPYTINSVTLI